MTSLAIPQIHQIRHGSTSLLCYHQSTPSPQSQMPQVRSSHVCGLSLAHSCVGFLGEVVGL